MMMIIIIYTQLASNQTACVCVRQTTNLVVRGLGRPCLCLSVYPPLDEPSGGLLSLPQHWRGSCCSLLLVQADWPTAPNAVCQCVPALRTDDPDVS